METSITHQNSKRIDYIDVAKGIGILLVIIGHSITDGWYESELRGMIYSFHMPLFFILAGMTLKFSADYEQLKNTCIKNVRKLIIPAVFIFAICVSAQCIQDVSCITDISFWRSKLYSLLFASGCRFNYYGISVEQIGITWFLFALCISKVIFDALHLISRDDITLLIYSCISCLIGVMFGYNQWLPFSADIAMAILPFLYFGYWLRKSNVLECKIQSSLIYGIIWILLLSITYPDSTNATYLELASRTYTFFPICYLTGIAGSLFVISVSEVISRIKIIREPIRYVGKHSIYLLGIHALDGLYQSMWMIEDSQLQTVLSRSAVDLLVFSILMIILYVCNFICHQRCASR